MEDREDLNRILECVQRLPDDRREALIMRFALGMDNREIARALGRTDGATKVLIHRAIRQLEELVQAEAGTEAIMSTWDFETRLREALAPVDPPADLEPRLEMTLGSLVEMAADELDAWELRAMRDPRNWPRTVLGPAAAVVVGSGAAAGLVILRTRGAAPQAARAGARRVGSRGAHVPRRGARGDARV